MPNYIATYNVDLIFEHTGDFMSVEYDYEFYADSDEEANQLADEYSQNEIYNDIMLSISIVPAVENVEEI